MPEHGDHVHQDVTVIEPPAPGGGSNKLKKGAKPGSGGLSMEKEAMEDARKLAGESTIQRGVWY
jgi:hypothetical protein